MIIENESNWRTDDLKARLESGMEQREFQLCPGVRTTTLILFKTSCKKATKDYDGEVTERPDAADYEMWTDRYDDTRTVSILSAKQLLMEPLDRLAHIGEAVQHMSTENVILVAGAIWKCLGRSGNYNEKAYEFVRTMNMRTRSRIIRSKVALKREIEALYWKQQTIKRRAHDRVEKLEVKRNALMAKLSELK